MGIWQKSLKKKYTDFKSWQFKILINYVCRYMLMALIAFTIFIPIRQIIHKQIRDEQISLSQIELNQAVKKFESINHNLRFTANKLFALPEFKRLVLAHNIKELKDPKDEILASQDLQKYSYNLDELSYLFIYFDRSPLVIDDRRIFQTFDKFYPAAFELDSLNAEDFKKKYIKSDQYKYSIVKCRLNRTIYPNDYLLLSSDAYSSKGLKEGKLFALMSKKYLKNLFLSQRMEDKDYKLYFYNANNGEYLITDDEVTENQTRELSEFKSSKDGDIEQSNLSLKSKRAKQIERTKIIDQNIDEDNVSCFELDGNIYVRQADRSGIYQVILEIPYTAIQEELIEIDRVLLLYAMLILMLTMVAAIWMSSKEIKALQGLYQDLFGNDAINPKTSENKSELLNLFLRKSKEMQKDLEIIEQELKIRRLDSALAGNLSKDKDKDLLKEELHLSKYNYLIYLNSQVKLARDFIDRTSSLDNNLGEEFLSDKSRKTYDYSYNEYSFASDNEELLIESEEKNLALHSSLIERWLLEKFEKKLVIRRNQYSDILLFISYDENREENLHQLCQIAETLKDEFSPTYPVVVSSVFESVDDLAHIHWQLRYMSNNNIGEDIVYMLELDSLKNSFTDFEALRNLEYALKACHLEDSQLILHNLFETEDMSQAALKEIYYSVRAMIFAVARETNTNNKNLAKLFPNVDKLADRNDFLNAMDQLVEYLNYEIACHKRFYRQSLKDEILRYIDENLDDKNLKAAKLAYIYNLSDNYISMLVKEDTGMSLYDYILKKRMSMAKELLATDFSLNLSDVANRVGFSKSNSFYKSFKKYYGVSPSVFRNSLKFTEQSQVEDNEDSKDGRDGIDNRDGRD